MGWVVGCLRWDYKIGQMQVCNLREREKERDAESPALHKQATQLLADLETWFMPLA